ncbi:MAG TPA: hypothetical protein VFL69_08185 [Marmoricola sp.]|jgi:hypothetical protein|nr:hypothetical protein [Marmoricola sp.]
MTTTTRSSYEHSTKGAWAYGLGMFAGVMLVTLGVLGLLQGIAALANDKIYVSGINYVYSFDLTTWGWIEVGIGSFAVIAGLGVLFEQSWGRILGVVMAVFSAMANFMFIPQYPVWSIVVIAFDIAAIWALSSLLANE